MKRAATRTPPGEGNGMRAEYNFAGGVRGKHYRAVQEGFFIAVHRANGTTVTKAVRPFNPSDFLRAAQARTARIAVSASAARGQRSGTVKAARRFLSTLDLGRFCVADTFAFRKQLDKATNELFQALPRGARHWGLARKLMNIFLRDALYTTYLCNTFHLDKAEEFYEIPLDSITSGHLRKFAGRGALPRWKGVRHLTPKESVCYQEYAKQLAQSHRLARVHLDTYWWGGRAG